jgi:4-amino-4-deoxy-L-arabinose transferase-like glycosyltransferase
MDGLIYSCVALNLHEGVGDFWHLSFTSTLYSHFHEHPPLAMWLQSIWMDLCGSSFWSDRFFSIITIFIQGILLVTLAKQVQNAFQTVGYWVMFFFFFNPLTLWMLPNNLLENTMGIFTLLSIILAHGSYQKKSIIRALGSGVMIAAAVYVKGPVGLFPFSFYVIFGTIGDQNYGFWKSVRYFLIQLLGFLIVFLLPLWILESAEESWKAYWSRQVVNSIQNVATVSHRFYVLQQLILHLLPMMVITFGYFLLIRKKKITLPIPNRGHWLPWLLFGLSGILPMMISLKQREFYILPALPFVILSFCILMQSSLVHFHEKWVSPISLLRIYQFTALIGVICQIIAVLYLNENHRNDVMQNDLKRMSSTVSEGTTLGIAHCLVEDWSLFGYAYRYYHWSLTESTEYPFWIGKEKNCDSPSAYFQKTTIQNQQYLLYQNTTDFNSKESLTP